MSRPISVVQFQRKQPAGAFSVERLFDDVRAALPSDISVKVHVNQNASRGLVGRVLDAITARRKRGVVNHVLGDVHYLMWFLPQRGAVLTVLDCVSLERMRGLRLGVFWMFWYWLPVRRAEQVTVISEYTRQALLKWVRYPADRIHVIRPPISAEFLPSPVPLRGERLRLLHVGTGPNKNLDRVIRAVQGLPVLLIIVGQLTEARRDELAAGDVPFENHCNLSRDELVEQYRSADALVFASTYEGFGLPIVEAQAVGRPVVTSNRCSMPEAAGGAACIVDPLDVEDIRRGIRLLIEDPEYCAELVQRGHANALQYTSERVAAQYAALYREMCTKGRSS